MDWSLLFLYGIWKLVKLFIVNLHLHRNPHVPRDHQVGFAVREMQKHRVKALLAGSMAAYLHITQEDDIKYIQIQPTAIICHRITNVI